MLSALATLTLRGSIVFGLVGLLELLAGRQMRSRSRRAWWWLVGFAFVVPLRLSFLPAPPAPVAAFRAQISLFAPSGETLSTPLRSAATTA